MQRGFGYQNRRNAGFNPATLFAGGINGAWFDPSDSTTLFTDRAGTTPCGTPGGGSVVPVGLMLDKSQGLQRFWSGYFDGTGDYLSTAASAGIAFGTGDFTIECWVNTQTVSNVTQKGIFQTSDTVGGLKASYTSGVTANFGGTGNGGLAISVGGTNYSTAANLVTISAWFHLAVTRAAGVVNVWLNGVSVASGSGNTNNLTGQYAAIGGYYSTAFLMTGNVSNFRIIKGTAIYTGTFTPPSPVTGLTAISGTSLLTCQNSTFIDNSGNNVTITANGDAVTSQNIPLGNHAIAANDTTARPELRARVNLLTYSEQFDNAAWSKSNCTAPATTAVAAPYGAGSVNKITENTSNNYHIVINQPPTILISASGITFVVYAKAAERTWLVFDTYIGNDVFTYFDLVNGVKGTVGANCTADISSAGNGWWKCTVTRTAAAGSYTCAHVVGPATGNNGGIYTGDGSSGIYVWGADMRQANIGSTIPAYQRISDANTYDAVGFPRYLAFNGTSSAMSTPGNVNLSGTDKATVFAGVRKLANGGVLTELSSAFGGNTGSFAIFAGTYATATGAVWTALSRGSATADPNQCVETSAIYGAPRTNILTEAANIGGDSTILRIDGAQVGQATGDQGTGNYGSYPLFIGARNNSSLFFNGNLYSLIVVGSAVSAGNITATEQWVAGKTGITI